MAMVYFLLDKPLEDSFLIGALVAFSLPSWKPPPWIMKFAMTRWGIAALDVFLGRPLAGFVRHDPQPAIIRLPAAVAVEHRPQALLDVPQERVPTVRRHAVERVVGEHGEPIPQALLTLQRRPA